MICARRTSVNLVSVATIRCRTYISRRLAEGCTVPSLKHLFDLSMSFIARRDTEAIPPSLVQEFIESVNNERMAQVALATVLLYFTSSGDHFLSYPHINVHCFS